MNIGVLSDTHGWIHPKLFSYFENCDEIWHAGDIGNIGTADCISAFKPLRAVFGNIDDATVRAVYKEHIRFRADDLNIWMTHIGGSPGRYDRRIRIALYKDPPDIFICGHSHIAKIMRDKKGGFLYLNPGAAGYHGFHKYMTAIRFKIKGKIIYDMELIHLGERGKAIL